MQGYATNTTDCMADWLVYRWEASITDYTADDPRYGIPPGLDEGDGFIAIFAGYPGSQGGHANQVGPAPSGVRVGFTLPVSSLLSVHL